MSKLETIVRKCGCEIGLSLFSLCIRHWAAEEQFALGKNSLLGAAIHRPIVFYFGCWDSPKSRLFDENFEHFIIKIRKRCNFRDYSRRSFSNHARGPRKRRISGLILEMFKTLKL